MRRIICNYEVTKDIIEHLDADTLNDRVEHEMVRKFAQTAVREGGIKMKVSENLRQPTSTVYSIEMFVMEANDCREMVRTINSLREDAETYGADNTVKRLDKLLELISK